MSQQYGPHRLLSDLTALGYSANLVQPPTGEYFVVLNNYVVEFGRFARRVIQLGVQATPDFPKTVSAAIHVKSSPHLLDLIDTVPNVRNIQPSALGPEWRYWSRNFGWSEEKSARRLMSQIAKIFYDA